jgi:4-amino-4-deoxy-L-arabinose transferase-like glycosyltransferase
MEGTLSKSALPRLAWRVVLALVAVKLALHLYAARYYGYFIDELYNLAVARHLGWGYLETTWILGRVVLSTLGDSLPAIRLLPALAGAGKVVLSAMMAREMGGGRFAQALAGLCFLAAPGLLLIDHLFTNNTFEAVCWMACAWLMMRIIRTGRTTLWLWFGVVAGLGLASKFSMLIFAAALVAGLFVTPARGLLWNRWIILGGAIALLPFLPQVIWNAQHHFPFLEVQENIRGDGRNVVLTASQFLVQEEMAILPLSIPVWIAGLWFFFVHPKGRQFRALGFAFLITTLVIFRMSPRIYYLFPAFPLLFAAGGVAFEQFRARWIQPAMCALLVLGGAALAPVALPLLPPDQYIRYSAATGLQQPRIENGPLGPLPQIFASQFGWQELVATVARVYNGLPAGLRERTAIFTLDYGQAGAIDLFGKRYGLPAAISGHMNYFFWGPREYTGESMIIVGYSRDVVEPLFDSVVVAAQAAHPFAMPNQHVNIYYCRGLKEPLPQLWPRMKNWH